MCNKSTILKAKEQWKEEGFIGGLIACNFLLMQERGLDVIYNNENELVQDYISLLKKRLETDNFSLVLMVNTEIEKCYIDEKEKIYEYLCDEIYEHFINSGKGYPLEAVGLHIDIITALAHLGEKEKFYNYLYKIKEVYKETFGDKSFLFCRNWSYILNEVLLEFIPEAAIEEFMDNIDLFSVTLREEGILYSLCINIAIERTNQEQNIDYIKKSIDFCEKWSKDISIEKQKEVQVLIRGIALMYYRNIGEYDAALKMYEKVLELTDDIHYKLFLLSQIASILYIKRDLRQLNEIFQNNINLVRALQNPDENVAELYNIYGLYYMQIGNYQEAQIQIEKAIHISEQVLGKEVDNTLKFKCNRILNKYNNGEYDTASVEMSELLDIVSENPVQYPETIPLILNNSIAMSFENRINSSMILAMKKVLESKKNKYDIASNIVFKCNLYYIMMALSDNYDEAVMEDLRKELEDYFNHYPYSEGYIQYLEGEYYRECRNKNISLGYTILEKIEKYFNKITRSIFSKEYFTFFIIKLKNYIYKKDYIAARKWLLSLWDVVLLPLFETLSNQDEENIKGTCLLLHSYISLFISSARQYPQLKITDKELYEFILNFKYFEDLFYCNKCKYSLALEKEKWVSIKSIALSVEKLIIECFCYTKYDMDDVKIVFGLANGDDSVYHICFGLEYKFSFLSKYNVEVISDISFTELCGKMNDLFETEEVSGVERTIWNKLKKFIDKKEKIFVCSDTLTVQIPLAAMRINEKQYWGERYQVIYCNTGKDVKDDIEIQNFSNSIYFGMSMFDDNDKKENSQKLQKKLYDLPYTELEIEVLGNLTGGKVYLDEEVSQSCFNTQGSNILHFATHTMEDEGDGEKSLVIRKESNGKYITLKSADIAKLDWRGVKLVVFSACETNEETWKKNGKNSLSQAAKKAGALFSISTLVEVNDGANAFFMVCFYKNLLRYKKIGRAFWETQRIMRTITKEEILSDSDYLDINMDYYLEDCEKDFIPFELVDFWAVYILQMN